MSDKIIHEDGIIAGIIHDSEDDPPLTEGQDVIEAEWPDGATTSDYTVTDGSLVKR